MDEVVNVFLVMAAVATIIGVYPTLKVITADMKAFIKKTRPSVAADSPVREKDAQGSDSTGDE